VPGTGEVARFPAETLGTHKDGNTEYNVTSTGSPTATPGNESLIKQPHCTIEGVQTKAASLTEPRNLAAVCAVKKCFMHAGCKEHFVLPAPLLMHQCLTTCPELQGTFTSC
jgi:hypothetical protein